MKEKLKLALKKKDVGKAELEQQTEELQCELRQALAEEAAKDEPMKKWRGCRRRYNSTR